MTYNDLQWSTMNYNDLQWSTMIYNDRTCNPCNELKWRLYRKRQKKKIRGRVRKRNLFSLLHDSPFNDDSISNYYSVIIHVWWYCDFCPNHPLQPFALVLFCLVFFSNKLNKHSHPNSRSGGIFKGRKGRDEKRRPSNSDPVQKKNCSFFLSTLACIRHHKTL